MTTIKAVTIFITSHVELFSSIIIRLLFSEHILTIQ